MAAATAFCARANTAGLDILVANAGIASAAPIEETTLAIWRRNYEVLAEGYFLASREAFPLLKAFGGSIVFVGSKNALAATPQCLRLRFRQGRCRASRPLPRAGRRAARHPGQRGQSRTR